MRAFSDHPKGDSLPEKAIQEDSLATDDSASGARNSGARKLTRRDFLKLGGGALASGAGLKFFEELSKANQVLNAVAWVADKADSAKGRVASKLETLDAFEGDTFRIERQAVLEDPKFVTEKVVIIERKEAKEKRKTCYFSTFDPNLNFKLQRLNTGFREELMSDEHFEGAIIGPVSYVEGDYVHLRASSKNPEEEPVKRGEIKFSLPAVSSDGVSLGASEIKSRFEGIDVGETLHNLSSGGVVIKNGLLVIVDKMGLVEAQEDGKAFLQAVYTIEQDNWKELSKQKWTFNGSEEEIGRSAYTWGAYVSYKIGEEDFMSYLVAGGSSEMITLDDFVHTCFELTQGNNLKIALMDASNGASIIERTSDLGEFKTFGPYKHNQMHRAPAVLVGE
ncbi:MAG: hypothetical protein AAB443_04195 [Patescibacteria group bacterium]